MMYLFWSRGEDFLRKALIAEMASKLMVEVGQKYKMLDDVIIEYETNGKYEFSFLVYPLKSLSHAIAYKQFKEENCFSSNISIMFVSDGSEKKLVNP